IGQTDLFQLEDIEKVFLKESREAIWQLVPRSGDNETNANEARVFTFTGKPTRAALRETIIEAMEAKDARRTQWIGTTTDGTTEYYFPSKYKGVAVTPIVE